MIPQTGAVKQYGSNDRTVSRRGKWFITLKYKPKKSKTWGSNKTNLHRLSSNLPYESQAEAEREVLAHQMILEGFVRGEGDDSKEFFESPAMVSAREKAEKNVVKTSFQKTLDDVADANDGPSHEARTHSRTQSRSAVQSLVQQLTTCCPLSISVIIIIIDHYSYFID